MVSRATTAGYDWDRTPAFPLLADYNGYLRFNLKGRESTGCLLAGGSEHLRYQKQLQERFYGLRSSDGGAPLVDELVAAAKVFPGERSDLLPDLIVTWGEQSPVTTVDARELGCFKAKFATGRSGNHRHEGFAIVQKPDPSYTEWQSVGHIKDMAQVLLRSFLGHSGGEA